MDIISFQSFFIALISLFLFANLKCLPFIWHLRLFTFLPRLLSPHRPRPTLFQPLIMHTRTPLFELDFMFHKNNGTFATDVDIARSHLIGALFLPVLWKPPASLLNPGGQQLSARGMLGIVLGGVAMWYKREIKSYQPYAIHTSLLTYDNKWIYFISHFIRSDFITSHDKHRLGGREAADKAVLATVISKNIFRLGREKVGPERVLRAAGLLPEQRHAEGMGGEDEKRRLSGEGVEERRRRGMEVVESNDGSVAHAWFGEMWAEAQMVGEGGEGDRVWEYRDWLAFG